MGLNKKQIWIIIISVVIQLIIAITFNTLFFKKVDWFREMIMFVMMWFLLQNIIREIQKFIGLVLKFSKDYNMFDTLKYSIDNLLHNRNAENAMNPEELKQEWDKK